MLWKTDSVVTCVLLHFLLLLLVLRHFSNELFVSPQSISFLDRWIHDKYQFVNTFVMYSAENAAVSKTKLQDNIHNFPCLD